MTIKEIEKRSRLFSSDGTWEIALQLAILNQRNAEYFAMAKEALKPRPLVTVRRMGRLRRRGIVRVARKVDAEFIAKPKRKRGA